MTPRLPPAFDKLTTLKYHLSFLVALTPVVVAAGVQQGWRVGAVTASSVAGAWAAETLLRRLRRFSGPQDWGSLLWGLLLALLLPVNIPLILPFVGSAFGILVVKGLLSGGGTPLINPVLASWAFLQVGWPSAFSALTPLGGAAPTAFDSAGTDWLNTNLFSWFSILLPGGYIDLVLGLGRPESALVVESGVLFLLASTVYLLAKGFLPWEIPVFFFVSFTAGFAFTGGNLLFQVFSGTLLLNLFFLAADPSSRPLGRRGLIVYATGAGLLSFLVRAWGHGDAVGYAVLAMNLIVPWLEQKLRRKGLNDFRLA